VDGVITLPNQKPLRAAVRPDLDVIRLRSSEADEV